MAGAAGPAGYSTSDEISNAANAPAANTGGSTNAVFRSGARTPAELPANRCFQRNTGASIRKYVIAAHIRLRDRYNRNSRLAPRTCVCAGIAVTVRWSIVRINGWTRGV